MAAPAQIFGGDCARLFTDDVVGTALGTGMTLQTEFDDSPNMNAVPTLSGLECTWAEPAALTEGIPVAGLSAVVLSTTAAVTSPDSVTCYSGVVTMSSDAQSTCRFAITAGDVWLSGTVFGSAGATEDDLRTSVATLSADFTALPASEAPVPALPAGAWRPPVCTDLSENAGVSSALASPDLSAGDVDTSGGEWADGAYAANSGAGVFACSWYQTGQTPDGQVDGFSIQALPGGAWAEAQARALPGATVVTIPGVELAVHVPPPAEGYETLDVFDGPNWLQVTRATGLDPVLPAVPGLIDALNAATAG